MWEEYPEAVGSTFQRGYERAVRIGEKVSVEEYFPPFDAWFEVNAYPSKEGLSVYFRDVTERKVLVERLEYQAFHDPLTGLANRSLLSERFEQAAGRADRAGKHLAILYLDLDGFKEVNDSLGHEAGDKLLVAVAERLGAHSRLGDTVARLGGDEFCILAEDVGGAEGAARVAGRGSRPGGFDRTLPDRGSPDLRERQHRRGRASARRGSIPGPAAARGGCRDVPGQEGEERRGARRSGGLRTSRSRPIAGDAREGAPAPRCVRGPRSLRGRAGSADDVE